jgi:hypothetical protein
MEQVLCTSIFGELLITRSYASGDPSPGKVMINPIIVKESWRLVATINWTTIGFPMDSLTRGVDIIIHLPTSRTCKLADGVHNVVSNYITW